MNISTTLLESLRNYNLRLDLRVDNNYDFSELATLEPRSLHLSLGSPGEYLMDYCSKELEYFQINGRGHGAFRLKNARVRSFLCESTDELEISADVQWLNASECGKLSTSPEFKCDSMFIRGVGELDLAGSIRKIDLYELVSFQLCLDDVRCENISISDSSFHDVSFPKDVDHVDFEKCKIRKLLIPSSAKRLRLDRCEIGKLEFERDCHLEKIFIDGVTFDLERLDLDCPKLRVCALENDPSNISDLRINTLSPKFKLINQGPKIEFRINAPKKIEVEGKFSAIYTYPTIIRWGIGSRTDLLFFVCNVDLSEFGECELADRVSYLFGSDDGVLPTHGGTPCVGAVPYGTKELVDSLPLPIAEEFEFIEGPNFEDFPFA